MKRFRKQFFCFLFIFCFGLSIIQVQAEETNETIKAVENNLNIKSEYAILINLNDDRILYEKKANEKMYPASMTKVMSALVAIEQIDDLNTTYVITEKDLQGLKEANASVAGFIEGEKVTYKDLLYGLLLPSGADASNALAHSLFGSQEAMVLKMNEKAKALNMRKTHFVNASGLHDDQHYTTVYDMSVLLKEALKNDMFKTVFCSETYQTSNGRMTMHSTAYKQSREHQLDISIISGAKTGFTNEASLCLASYVQQGSEEYIMVSGQTHSDSSQAYHLEDALKMYQYVFDHYERKTIIKKNDVIGKFKVRYASKEAYEVYATSDISLLVNTANMPLQVEFIEMKELDAPIFTQSIVGTLLIQDGKEVVYEEDIMLDETITTNYIHYYMRHPDHFVIDYAYHIGAIILAFISGIIYKHKKKQQIH